MNIYQLDQEKDFDYDTIQRFVVIAKNAKEARVLAAKKARDAGPSIWLEPTRSKIQNLGVAKSDPLNPRVVCEEGLDG